MNAILNSVLASSELHRQPSFTSSSVSAFGLSMGDILQHGLVREQYTTPRHYDPAQIGLEEQLFKSLAAAKIWTSQVAMRLDTLSRDRFFTQLDRLHDIEDWFEGDEPVILASYSGFIRLMLIVGCNSKPALALSPSGHMVAIWENDGQRLTVEFKDTDRLQWLVNCGDGDRTAGTATLQTVVRHLEPYNPMAWFDVA